MRTSYRKTFLKMYNRLDKRLQSQVDERIGIFESSPFHELLHNHPLTGEYLGYRSINITGDYRAIFEELSDNTYEFVEFVSIGTHSQLYG